MKVYESEWNVLQIIWERNAIKASEIAVILNEKIGWNRNTTYTVIKRCLEKNLIERIEPGFVCVAKIEKAEVLEREADNIIEERFGGSLPCFVAAFAKTNKLSKDEINEIWNIINMGE